ncbi:MAG TPA: hypothetical protein DIS62_02640 [Candidatus Kerfeldbacteria bacterium]|nr:hypothetical protein [Candidatus Kerfeldbacteria bacterium]
MDVWIFGNPDLPEDALPLRLFNKLKKAFPHITFLFQDPLDEWDLPEKIIMIDTVKGIDAVSEFTSLEQFQAAPHVTMHDFDLGAQLAFLQKLRKLPKFVLIGVPDTLSEDRALEQVSAMLRRYVP